MRMVKLQGSLRAKHYMKKLVPIGIFLPTFFAFTSLFVLGQTIKKNEIKRIDAYAKTVDAFVKRYKGPHLIFADVSHDGDPRWEKFASEKALEKFRENSETYSIAYNWQKNQRILKSNFTLFSESGDWAQYVDYYFREDGTLARGESELRTFNGDYIVIRRHYFHRNGKLIHRSIKYLDLDTRKPKKPSDYLGDNSPWNVDYFKKTSKLPFAHLIKK